MAQQALNKTLETESEKRKKDLIQELNSMEIYYTSDGRNLENVRLYTLEWTYIVMKNDIAKACSE